MTSRHNDPPPGRCPECGYPKTDGVCPECGTHSEANQLVPPHYWTRRQKLTLLLCSAAAVLVAIAALITLTGGWLRLLPDRALVLMSGGEADARVDEELASRLYDGTLSTGGYATIIARGSASPGNLTVEPAVRSSDKLDVTLAVNFRLPPPFTKPVKYCVVPGTIEVTIDGEPVGISDVTVVSGCRRYLRIRLRSPGPVLAHVAVTATVGIEFPDRPDVGATRSFEIDAETDIDLRREPASGRPGE